MITARRSRRGRDRIINDALERRRAGCSPGDRPPPREDAMKETTPHGRTLLRGIWRENPVSDPDARAVPAAGRDEHGGEQPRHGARDLLRAVRSSLLVSTVLKRSSRHEVRISTYILIIATFVTVADLVLEAAIVPDVHKDARRVHRADRRELHDPRPPGGLRLEAAGGTCVARRRGDGHRLHDRPLPHGGGVPRDPRRGDDPSAHQRSSATTSSRGSS